MRGRRTNHPASSIWIPSGTAVRLLLWLFVRREGRRADAAPAELLIHAAGRSKAAAHGRMDGHVNSAASPPVIRRAIAATLRVMWPRHACVLHAAYPLLPPKLPNEELANDELYAALPNGVAP